ncbi:NUDIX domain-containing protein [Pseudochryseolinea flava]|uniref:DNA mismatch repair protein MutT n=1 Tax=Pseudochryseolinea flava TaxID=2059302 RepID=A0A364Y3J1_9BACT|nr:NUDIX domain-containing protein [Pseudochryseolinea flava]RAW00716.1 DNA mismatch repair protein MutT [Pseudochryseolinea flava]
MNKEIRPAVAAVIFNEAGEVLLHKRRDVEQWSIISGHVEFGESVRDAILREIKEEVNAEAEIVRLIGVYSAPNSATYHYDERIVHFVTTYFEIKLLTAIPKNVSNEETMAVKFFPTEHLPTSMALINPHWLEDALNTTHGPFVR